MSFNDWLKIIGFSRTHGTYTNEVKWSDTKAQEKLSNNLLQNTKGKKRFKGNCLIES